MAIILKKNTALNNLVTELENKIEKVNKTKAELEERKDLLDRKLKQVVRTHKRFARKSFNKRYGFVFLGFVILSITCLMFVLFFSQLHFGKSAAEFSAYCALCGVMVVFAYFCANKVYWISVKKNITSEAFVQIINEYEQLREDIKKATQYRETVLQELVARTSEVSGNDGECSVTDYIEHNFDDNCYLLNDVNIQYGKKKAQIDHILVCDRGVFCIETKNFGIPYYQENDKEWAFYRGSNHSEKVMIKSPQAQSEYHVQVLNALLKGGFASYPIVVIANKKGSFSGSYDRCPVVYIEQLKKIVKSHQKCYSATQVIDLANQILKISKK